MQHNKTKQKKTFFSQVRFSRGNTHQLHSTTRFSHRIVFCRVSKDSKIIGCLFQHVVELTTILLTLELAEKVKVGLYNLLLEFFRLPLVVRMTVNTEALLARLVEHFQIAIHFDSTSLDHHLL